MARKLTGMTGKLTEPSPCKCPECGQIGQAKYSLPDGETVYLACGHEDGVVPEKA